MTEAMIEMEPEMGSSAAVQAKTCGNCGRRKLEKPGNEMEYVWCTADKWRRPKRRPGCKRWIEKKEG